ncbi:MAG: NAD(P)H-dependent glycerol-3-phosphate dehydrogenase [Myxococcota bacterium]
MDPTNPVRVGVLGAGSFGTCLAILSSELGHSVTLWARDATVVKAINRHHRNPRYLTEFRIPESVRATDEIEAAVSEQDLVLSVVPSHAVRETWKLAVAALNPETLIVSGTKGIEVGTGQLMSESLRGLLPPECHPRIVVLSGPSFSREIADGRPTAVSLACPNDSFAIATQTLLSSRRFRCYTNPDVVGVELGGALKNVVAIAVGICDGLNLGQNARAALITRGLTEMTRLGTAMGANPMTFLGLSGIGDLVLTCTGDLSRNRRVGIAIGEGRALDDILAGLHQVAEGVRTTRSAYELAGKHQVEMPITESVYRVLYEGLDPREAVASLTARQLRSELD